MDPNVRIYVATHIPDPSTKFLDPSISVPILCGKVLRSEEDLSADGIPDLGDDTGDNISDENDTFSELTALYWIWKNDKSKPDDIVGLEHYRRHFRDPHKYSIPITKSSVIELISKYDFMGEGFAVKGIQLFKPDKIPVRTLYNHYKIYHVISDLDNALESIRRRHPELYPVINCQIKHSNKILGCNVFVTKKKLLDEYCEFLFPVLFDVDDKIDEMSWLLGKHSGYNSRVFGFLSERLLRPWIVAKGYTACCPGMVDWASYCESIEKEGGK